MAKKNTETFNATRVNPQKKRIVMCCKHQAPNLTDRQKKKKNTLKTCNLNYGTPKEHAIWTRSKGFALKSTVYSHQQFNVP